MDKNKKIKLSKALSFWLRHKPEDIGIIIGNNGWVDVKELIKKAENKLMFDFNDLKYVVDNCDKKRFKFSDDFCEIKANQGFSIDVKLEFEEVIPPTFLYHGTSEKEVDSIMKTGLKKMKRHHVHLSSNIDIAKKVANRRKGKNIILKIEAMRMHADGYKIYISDNGVYLIDEVPAKYIKIK